MFQGLSFRAKLLLILFVPFLALMLVAGAGLRDRFWDLRAQEQFGTISEPLDALGQLSDALQREAVASSWYVAARGKASSAAELTEAQRQTDRAVGAYLAQREQLLLGASDDTAAVVRSIDPDLAQLDVQRDRVRRLASGAGATATFLLNVDDRLISGGERVARGLRGAEAGASMLRAFDLHRESLELAREAAIYVGVTGSETTAQFAEWVNAIGAQIRYHREFTSTATADELRAYEGAVSGDVVLPEVVPTQFPASRVAPAQYYASYESRAGKLAQASDSVKDVIAGASAARAGAARTDAWVYGGGAVVAMLVTLALTWFVVGAVLRPLRRLTSAAREMSQHQLPRLIESLRKGGEVTFVEPTPIEVTAEDEIGELARAFTDVEAVTVSVAKEQSRLLRQGMGELFVNLARRNQSLLERQLALLDELEHVEQDPAALESLFRLDHMATRMRRNAESLLVLSGSEQPRQWQEPIGLLDVVRAAAAEIADFPRVDLAGVDAPVAVSGRAVADVAHLLAELLENATSFSSPQSPVIVTGAPTAAGFVLAISDQGIGIPAERLAEVNHLLSHPPVVGLALSRSLGLHVVGLLAARHGIGVELRAGAPVGVIALILLPTAILEAPASAREADVAPPGVAWRPLDEPPVEEWRREGMTADEGVADPPLVGEPVSDGADLPLPSRVPGRNLTHQPTATGDAGMPESDPTRAQRVHDMLTRHALGIRRGRGESDGTEQEPLS